MSYYTILVEELDQAAISKSPASCGKYWTVGYMNILFDNKHAARKYIKRNMELPNPGAAPIHVVGLGVDPSTLKRYTVIKYREQMMDLPPFNPKDSPSIKLNRDGGALIASVDATYKTGGKTFTLNIA